MKEIRFQPLELRELDIDNRHVEGYALVFNVESNDLGGFVEEIDPNSLDGVLEISDILCPLNHDESRGILARSTYMQGTLKLEIDRIGLKYSFDAPNTALGDELLEGLRRKDIRNSSFAFIVEKDEFIKLPTGLYKRRILKFKELFDVSPVYKPAYSQTSIDLRGLEAVKAKEKMIEDNRNELNSYYKQLKEQYGIKQ